VSELLYESDWLGSRPVYYNERTEAASDCINDVIDFANVEFDAEGLGAYLSTGFSVFGHTPVLGVRSLPPSARLWRDDGGRLRVEETRPDLEARVATRRTEGEVIELLRARVRAAESSATGEIVIPTSGGYDSRLLNLMIAEPSRIRSFTFGPTARQWDSAEVARARELSEMLGTKWERVHLAPFHTHLDAWDDAFGPALHAHGMYQLEFYRQVCTRLAGGELLLSGLGGDWLEGKGDWMSLRPLSEPRDVLRLIHTNGMHADVNAAVLRHRGLLLDEYYDEHREILASRLGRLIEAVRFRFALTHYLLRVPQLYGLTVDAPFVDMDVATAMLSLPDGRRDQRRWVRDYLAAQGALLEDAGGNSAYWLYWPVMRAQPLTPLDDGLLSEIVRPDYVRWINRTVGWRGVWWEGYQRLSGKRGFRRAARYLESKGLRQRRLEAYHAYMTLRPLERVLLKRDAAQQAGS
jgi:asparagine synthetase B (glutamine-hydrolysing)